MGMADRVIRASIAVIIAILYFMDIISGTGAVILLAFGCILLLTVLLSVCPLYTFLGLSTSKKGEVKV